MARVATKLSPTHGGGFSARKRIPLDVRSEYAKLYGRSSEEWFNSGPVTALIARAKCRDWLTEIEGRIATIRAERNGQGRPLTPMQARALAGEWYHWFTTKHGGQKASAVHWETLGGLLTADLSAAADNAVGDGFDIPRNDSGGRDLARIWEGSREVRADMRPVVADRGETAQFLHSKRLTLDPASRDMFLDHVGQDLFAALGLLQRHAQGDYSPDDYAEQFPQFERTGDPGLTAWVLFQRWIEKAKPRVSTVDRWRGVFLDLKEHFGATRGAAGITPEEANAWAQGLVTADRSARTVRDVWVMASKAVFQFSVDNRLLVRNPFTKIKITVPRAIRTRDTKAFTSDEARTILRAAIAIASTKSKGAAAKRWVPWLCAYTGARAGEIAQLRGSDVIRAEGINALKITPEAGTVKTGRPRTVPLHQHLIDQGFLEFVGESGKGPLFYNEPKGKPVVPSDATNPPKPRYVKVREHIAAWVRELGVTDPEVKPNHAWRDTFKQIGHRTGIRETMWDEIVGHAPETVGKGYGLPTIKDKAEALKEFPRYDLRQPNGEEGE